MHHPIDVTKYYEEQKDAALARAAGLRSGRIPKFLKYFQTVLESNPAAETEGREGKGKSTYLVGAQTTTADLAVFHVSLSTSYYCNVRCVTDCVASLWQIIEGLTFAFPKRMAVVKKSGKYDNVFALRDRVAEEKGIKEYLQSDRRQPFSNGIFRHYEELDAEE